ncbi:MAG: hypothetical protein AAGB10_16960 [Pseudomonadota bacterium]
MLDLTYLLGIALPFAMFLLVSFAMSRAFARTGHAWVWRLLSFLPVALVSAEFTATFLYGIDHGLEGLGTLAIVSLVVLIVVFAFKPWPS